MLYNYWCDFKAGDGGCYSHVGYQGGAQELNLKKSEPGSGCFRLATIIHEFLHGETNCHNWMSVKFILLMNNSNLLALGFFHMQSAYDRDEYVTIVWDKISPGKGGNFKKYTNTEITHFNTTYDYYSVMHYGPNGFSIDGTATIVPTVRQISSYENRYRINIFFSRFLRIHHMLKSLASDRDWARKTFWNLIECTNVRAKFKHREKISGSI